MRGVLAITLAMAAGLFVANMLGVASAEAPTGTTTTPRTLSVQGVASIPIAQDANLEVADAAYRQALAASMKDGQGKAEFLAEKAAATLGSVQSIIEDNGSIECSAQAEGTEGQGPEYARYEGETPDFGTGALVSSDRGIVAPEVATARAPAVRVNRKKTKRKPTAKKASAVTCKLSASVLLSYAIN
jgi:hypothetical protein